MTNLEKIATNELQQRAANVFITYAICGGHRKSRRNEIELNRIIDEMNTRGLVRDENIKGIFNGEGSS